MRLAGLALAAALQPAPQLFAPRVHAPIRWQPAQPPRHARCSARALLLDDETVATPPEEEADENEEMAHPWTKPLISTAAQDPYRVLRRVAPSCMFHLVWTSLVVTLRCAFGVRWVIPPLLHMLTGSVLGLLLAFRTNQAFERYWSACKSWAEVRDTAEMQPRCSRDAAEIRPSYGLQELG